MDSDCAAKPAIMRLLPGERDDLDRLNSASTSERTPAWSTRRPEGLIWAGDTSIESYRKGNASRGPIEDTRESDQPLSTVN